MKYVILKKINNTWYATRNRYTAKELELIVDKLYNDIVDFETINDGVIFLGAVCARVKWYNKYVNTNDEELPENSKTIGMM